MNTVPKEALKFLEQLKRNNNRDWFNEHKPKFKTLEQEVKEFYTEVETLLNQHDKIQKTKAYRIYRDIRFSKDKTPYKTHFAANFQRQKPALRGGYYVHLAAGNKSMVGAGFWKPHKDDLKRVREEWALDADEIREILNQKDFIKYWGNMKGKTLKTAPRGFDRNHPDIDLINHKQWVFAHYFEDKEVLADDFALKVNVYFKKIRPFFDYMSDVLTTDLNGVSLID